MMNKSDLTFDYIQNIIETSNSIAHCDFLNEEIEYIDLMVELIKDEKPLNKTVGVKLKTERGVLTDEDRSYQLTNEQFDYYKNNKLSMLYIFFNDFENSMLWEYVEIANNKTIKSNKENEFTMSSFNFDVIPFMLKEQLTLKNLKRNIHEPEYAELKSFLMNRFNIIELIYPLILGNKTFKDFIESIDLKIHGVIQQEMNPLLFDTIGNGPQGIQLGNTIHSWIYHTKEAVFITPDKYILLNNQYAEINNSFN